ncbi:DUF927 domain-containing protein [Methylobacterium sp. NEAU 140]|uniref:DUF927 domain-containing protein n=1 Tax=Methylobacterium sp. NEAU 140 TaxID=3064945 RepID=UPI0027341E0E|nr:DUF927 domain-containing protein [Methylobacterium sp. NEAU 140]MDP4024441.1 DUF927 domain-containing protein [Methylobacterium sp. NEAU 140]
MSDGAGERYVSWKLARPAVEGHEVEIVRALGIAWQAGQRDHITCPYPGHGGAKDWRLNSKGRGICTCTQPHTDSVFDIAMKVEGLDAEQAKIRCVEIIGRTDLIRTKSGAGAGQATDAESLMRAPAERRDDALPRAYLAHRLGIEADAVLMPTTPTVGLRALGYFDPPKGKGTGKPIHVGDFPCAVFGQIDAEARRHAHRIYVAPGGAGKADLGMAGNGTMRDAKKSAKRVGEESTAGRAAIWGDAHRAPWCIIAEGIETAAAVAHAFRPEVEAGAVYVAAGINAGGIESFIPWPETARVTVAADRDEAVKITSPNPSRRGETAARRFGIRHHERIAISFALAGSPGCSKDWLDVHVEQGVEAVRAGILAAVAFTATAEEVEDEQRRTEELDELRRVERDYPLPDLEGLSLSYERTRKGRVRVHHWVKGDEGVPVPVPVASPFGVTARLRYVDQGDAYGLRLVVEDMGGKRREIDVDRATFAKQGAAETRAMLYGAGMRAEGDGEHIAVKALKAADPEAEIAVVRRPGWHDLEDGGDKFFVCPSGEIIGLPPGRALELSNGSRISEVIARGGTLEGWKAAIAAAAEVTRCPHWTIGTLAGFAAVLISLTDHASCGINLSGYTSGGKTTSQRLAVSVWSRAALDQRDSLLQSARATANGLEGMASRASGTILALDDLGHLHGKELGRIIYSLSSGVGKGRMTADAKMRASYVWSTFVILSSEKSLEEKVRGEGGEWTGGMAARIPDIDIDGVDRSVDRSIMARIEAVDQHFGHAGPAFVRALVSHGLHREAAAIREGIDNTASRFAGRGAESARKRAALPFAIMLTAGRMARDKFGLLPAGMDIEGAIKWAWESFGASTDAIALDPEAQAIHGLQAWIAERWDTSIHRNDLDTSQGDRRPNQRADGWYSDKAVFIPTRNIVAAAGGALKESEIARVLKTRGLICQTKSEKHLYIDYIPKIGSVKAYALSRSEFGHTGRDNPLEPPVFKVHEGGRY